MALTAVRQAPAAGTCAVAGAVADEAAVLGTAGGRAMAGARQMKQRPCVLSWKTRSATWFCSLEWLGWCRRKCGAPLRSESLHFLHQYGSLTFTQPSSADGSGELKALRAVAAGGAWWRRAAVPSGAAETRAR